MENQKEKSKILKLIDEIFIQKINNKSLTDEQKQKINSLSNKELSYLISLYSNLIQYETSTEQKELPEFYLYRIKDYYRLNKQKEKKASSMIPEIIIKITNNTLNVIENRLQNFKLEIAPIPNFRDSTKINKILLEDSQQDKKLQISIFPQNDSALLSIFLENVNGYLTLKLRKNNNIIDIKHLSILNLQERINLENLKPAEYILEFSGSYENTLKINILN